MGLETTPLTEFMDLYVFQESQVKARIGWQSLTTREYLKSGEYGLVGGTNLVDGKIDWDSIPYVSKWRYDQDKFIQLQQNDVLISKDGTIGKIAFVDSLPFPSTLNSGVYVIRPKEGKYDPSFMYHLLNSFIFEDFIEKLSAGSTISHLYQKDLKHFFVQIPSSLGAQKAIAGVLSDADKNISTLTSQISKYELFQIGLRTKLLSGAQRISGFEAQWETQCLGQLTEPVMGQSPLSASYNKLRNGIPLVQGQADIEKGFSLERTWTTQPTRTVPRGTVLMSVRAPVGAISIASSEVCLGRGMAGFIPKRIDPGYLKHLLRFIEPEWSVFEQGSTFTAVNKSTVVNFEVSVPSTIEEQKAIAQILDSVGEYLLSLSILLKKLECLKQGMMNDLLTGKVRLV